MSEKADSYIKLREELDAVLVELESNTDDIDKAIERYKKGVEIIAKIEKYLDKAKAKIDILKPPK